MNKTVQGEDKNGNKIEMNVADLSWRISVYGVVVQDEKVLMMSQNFGYSVPGGAIEIGEKHEDALRREMEEETGYQVEIESLLDVKTSFFKLPTSKKHIHAIRIFYKCKIIDGKLNENPDLTPAEKSWNSKPEWISLSELENIKIGDSADIVGIIKKSQN